MGIPIFKSFQETLFKEFIGTTFSTRRKVSYSFGKSRSEDFLFPFWIKKEYKNDSYKRIPTILFRVKDQRKKGKRNCASSKEKIGFYLDRGKRSN